MDRFTLTRPDDWHIHLRDDAMLPVTVADVSRYFGRAIVMPNLKPPVVTTAQAGEYYQRLRQQIPADSGFSPLMTLYLTDNTTAEEIVRADDSEWVFAVKYYPAGATTNSESGVTDIRHCYPALEKMAELGMPLLLHGEVTDTAVDIFDREKTFIDNTLTKLVNDLPALKIVLEHITTAEAAQFVEDGPTRIAATITPQHLLFNRNHLLAGGIRPHYYCLPVLKRNTHQQALLRVATSGNPRFFLGTDSAPHTRATKETDCGCAGCYSAPAAIELYAEAFESMGALDKLEGFASHHGPDFYGLPRNADQITLQRSPWQIPEQVAVGDEVIVPLMAGQSIAWQVVPR